MNRQIKYHLLIRHFAFCEIFIVYLYRHKKGLFSKHLAKRFGYSILFTIVVGLAASVCSEPSRPTEAIKSAPVAKSVQADKSTSGKKSAQVESKYPPLEAQDYLYDQPSEESKRKIRPRRRGGYFTVTEPLGTIKVISRKRIGGKGRLNRRALDNSIDRLITELIICYRKELNTKREEKGRLTIWFSVKSDGNVTNTRLKGPFSSGRTASCFRSLMRVFRFDPPPKGGRVDYRYTFKLEPGPDKTYTIRPD